MNQNPSLGWFSVGLIIVPDLAVQLNGALGEIRERALLAMRFASEAGSRRRIPT
jgi:hypothetical protein